MFDRLTGAGAGFELGGGRRYGVGWGVVNFINDAEVSKRPL